MKNKTPSTRAGRDALATAPKASESRAPTASAARAGARTRAFISVVLWMLATTMLVTAAVRAARSGSASVAGTRPYVEDRRAHHFRDLTYGQTKRLVQHLLRQAQTARTQRDRAVALARAASIQRERNLRESALAAGDEALQMTGNDPEIHAILVNPVRLEDIVPSRERPRVVPGREAPRPGSTPVPDKR